MKSNISEPKDYKKPRQVSQGVKIKIEETDLSKSLENGLNITGITANGILYIPITYFSAKYKVSYSTICRNIEKLRYRHDAWKYFLKIGNKNYVSCGIVGNRKKNTGQFSNSEYADWLSCYTWDIVGSVSYSNHYTELAARKSMEKLYKRISQQYYNKEVLFFYVSEPNPSSEGWHNHFLFGFQGEVPFSDAKSLIENTLRADKVGNKSITKIEPYRSNEYFIGYVVKKLHLAKDGYDFMSNKLLN